MSRAQKWHRQGGIDDADRCCLSANANLSEWCQVLVNEQKQLSCRSTRKIGAEGERGWGRVSKWMSNYFRRSVAISLLPASGQYKVEAAASAHGAPQCTTLNRLILILFERISMGCNSKIAQIKQNVDTTLLLTEHWCWSHSISRSHWHSWRERAKLTIALQLLSTLCHLKTFTQHSTKCNKRKNQKKQTWK